MKRENLREHEQAECLGRAVEHVLQVTHECDVSERTLCEALHIDKRQLVRLKKMSAVNPKNYWAA